MFTVKNLATYTYIYTCKENIIIYRKCIQPVIVGTFLIQIIICSAMAMVTMITVTLVTMVTMAARAMVTTVAMIDIMVTHSAMLLLLLLGVTRPLGLRKDLFSTGFVTKPKKHDFTWVESSCRCCCSMESYTHSWKSNRGAFCRKKVQPHRSDQDSAVCSGKKAKLWAANLVAKTLRFWIPQGSWIFTFFLENYVMSEERKYIYNPKEWHYQKNN